MLGLTISIILGICLIGVCLWALIYDSICNINYLKNGGDDE